MRDHRKTKQQRTNSIMKMAAARTFSCPRYGKIIVPIDHRSRQRAKIGKFLPPLMRRSNIALNMAALGKLSLITPYIVTVEARNADVVMYRG